MSEHRDGSAVRVMTAPWRANFLAGFRAIPGLVSLGTFFASKESASATPKAFKKARREGENHIKTNSKTQRAAPNRCASKESTSATPKAFKKPAAKAK